ncbi:hypothetical protein Tco_0012428 [Tanacetum coccineum]
MVTCWQKCGSTKDRPFKLLYWSYKVVKFRYIHYDPGQNGWIYLPRDIPLDSVVVLRYEKRSKCENKGKVPTEMELVLEQTQQGTSYEVLVSTEGVEELKRKVKIKGEKKEALLTLRQKPDSLTVKDIQLPYHNHKMRERDEIFLCLLMWEEELTGEFLEIDEDKEREYDLGMRMRV